MEVQGVWILNKLVLHKWYKSAENEIQSNILNITILIMHWYICSSKQWHSWHFAEGIKNQMNSNNAKFPNLNRHECGVFIACTLHANHSCQSQYQSLQHVAGIKRSSRQMFQAGQENGNVSDGHKTVMKWTSSVFMATPIQCFPSGHAPR